MLAHIHKSQTHQNMQSHRDENISSQYVHDGRISIHFEGLFRHYYVVLEVIEGNQRPFFRWVRPINDHFGPITILRGWRRGMQNDRRQRGDHFGERTDQAGSR